MTKANMLLSSSTFRSSGPVVSGAEARRRRRVARHRGRRGIILIFVVVLLMLLAIMGTAYLATSRADRLALNGNGAIAGTTSPRLADRGKLDALYEASARRVQYAVIEDLFNVAPGALPKIERDAASGTTNTANAAKARLAAAFRQQLLPAVSGGGANADPGRYYKNYDAAGRADPYLSSLLPVVGAPGSYRGGNALIWPWIGGPLAGEISPGVELAPFFADPRLLSRSTPATNFGFTFRYGELPTVGAAPADARYERQVTNRLDVPITSIAMLRSDASPNALPTGKTTRVYPAFNYTGGPAGEPVGTFLASDTDGDGIADGGMMPILINPNANNWVDRYLDQANGVVYFMSYRVVDNSAQLNVNTALSAKGDFNFVGTPGMGGASLSLRTRFETNAADSPNLGFYKSNVGLVELIRNSLEVYGAGTASTEIDRLTDTHFPNIPSTVEPSPVGAGSNVDSVIRRIGLTPNPEHPTEMAPVVARIIQGDRNAPSTVAPAEEWFYRFRSFGDLAEQTLARRPDEVGGVRTAVTKLSNTALVSLPLADSIAFASGGGSLLNPRSTSAATEDALLLSTHMLAANFSGSTNDPWRWFPADQPAVWFGWTKNFMQSDGNATTPQPTDYQIALLDGGVNTRDYDFPAGTSSGMTPISLPISIRPLLTTHNGVTSAAPKRYSTDPGKVPPGMPTYTQYPAVRVPAATGTKEQLWRAYWSVMTQNYVPAGGQVVTNRVDKNLSYPSIVAADVVATKGTGSFEYDNDPQVLADPYQKNYDAFLPPDRYADAIRPDPATILQTPGSFHAHEQLNPDQMALMRSAVAACNTIDLRDVDNDITAMTVDLGPTVQLFPGNVLTGDPADVNYGARNELYARIYGTEKQLVITGVMIDDSDTDGLGSINANVIVEIFNPTDEVLDLRGYYLAVADRGTTPVTGETTDTGIVTIDQAGRGADVPTMANSHLVAAGVTTIEPGGFLIVTNRATPTVPTGSTIVIKPEVTATHTTTPPTSDPVFTAPASQVTYINNVLGLSQLQGRDTSAAPRLNRELVLLRTRRADGIAFNDNPALRTQTPPQTNLPVFNEVTVNEPGAAVRDLESLVPIDSVDCRSLNYSPDGSGVSRHYYLRSTTPPNYFTANPLAWKTFYAGVMYNQRPGRQDPTLTTLPTGASTQTLIPAMQDPTGTLAARPADWAWREYPSAAYPMPSTDAVFGAYRSTDPTLAPPTGPVPPDINTPTAGQVLIPTPYFAPTIPIQNAKPWTVFDPTVVYNPTATNAALNGVVGPIVDHPPFQFPYGSPFARDGDLLNVPFIGSYKIYRVNISGGDPGTRSPISIPAPLAPGANPVPNEFALYEYVALPVDAVNVAPVSAEWTSPKRNPSVGRFDPNPSLFPKNDWAADLFDFVSARKQDGKNLSFPDIPTVKADAGNTVNNALDPTTDQDGPVIGYGVFEVNPTLPVPTTYVHPSLKTTWTEWMIDALPAPVSHGTPGGPAVSRGTGVENAGTSGSGSLLIEGKVNLNTAPPVVLRMLPWTVDPADGLLNQGVGPTGVPFDNVVNQAQRARVGIVKNFLENPAASTAVVKTGREHALRSEPPFGFTSPMDLSEINQLKSFDTVVANADPRLVTLDAALPGPNTNHQYLRYGMLNPKYRSNRENDFTLANLNMNRVSNLTSQRSDVFTVYVTVQAWTYVGEKNNAQMLDTRLVGERRGSFIVDRSRINEEHYKPSDLILYPVEQE